MTPPIAIVGMACQYPDARSPAELWENVLAQRRAFRRIPDQRLRLADYLSSDRSTPDTTYSAEAALIEGYEFDRARYRVVGSTYRATDMTHWLALDVAAAALADAGLADGAGLPVASTGVLVGNSLTGEFARANLMRLRWPYVRRVMASALQRAGWQTDRSDSFLAELEAEYKAPFPPVGDESLAGGLSNTIAGRICNHFNLGGGGYTVDGACASSLLAVATACSALLSGDLDVALAGGVDLSLDPFELVGFAKVGALAETEMQVYDARSAGFWPGEGCSFLVLMRADEAQRAGCRVYARICGWGVSSDGSGGITRPEVAGQRLALERAYRRAGFGIETIDYFEGHGTGTSVGDATELEALDSARRAAGASEAAAIGSIKANIGHTKAAAGTAGLIKAALAVHHQVLPPTTGVDQPHPIFRDASPVLRLLSEGESWPAKTTCRAAVSAMGFGGINAHVVLESTARRPRPLGLTTQMLLASSQDAELFVFGAPDRTALQRLVERVQARASALSRSELTDLAAHLALHHLGGRWRAAVVARRPAELNTRLARLAGWLADDEFDATDPQTWQRLEMSSGIMLGARGQTPRIGLLMPGQAAPSNISGGAWRRRFDFVRARYDQIELPQATDTSATELAQPAIVTASLAALDLIDRCGLEGACAVGHSLGELVAYHWARAITASALLRFAHMRGRVMAQLPGPPGAMVSLSASREAVLQLCGGEPVVIAGLNSPHQTVISGEVQAVEAVARRAEAAQIRATRLPVSHAFHSPLMEGAASTLKSAAESLQLSELSAPIYSTITGARLPPDTDLTQLLYRQLTSPVHFMDALRAADEDVDLWIEVGPGRVLQGIASQVIETPVVSLESGGETLVPLLVTMGVAYALGAPVDVRTLFESRFARSFQLDSEPQFLVNPCELAPAADVPHMKIDQPASPASTSADWQPELSDTPAVLTSGIAPLDVVKQLVAARAEIPLEAVGAKDRLLSDLHFSSLTVGQIAVEAARLLELPPPAQPTAAANVTVAELADALTELRVTGGQPKADADPEVRGVAGWVRTFTVELAERALPTSRPPRPHGSWKVITSDDDPRRGQLECALCETAGRGVVVCLPSGRDPRVIELLLHAGREVIDARQDTCFVLIESDGLGAPFARSLHLELPHVDTCVVNVPADDARITQWLTAEIATVSGYGEAHYSPDGTRCEPILRLLPKDVAERELPLDADDVILVTGGGKGIGAECAVALARESGARLALVGRSRVEQDTELAANLHRLQTHGVRYGYYRADVTSLAQVQEAVAAVRAELGEITAILHAAGTNSPLPLASLDLDAFQRTLGPKVQGCENVLAAVDPEPVRLLVAFGSIIARSGMRGNADYAVANAWLVSLVAQWQQTHPHCHSIAAEWSVWAGTGMGERLGSIDALRREGIAAIPLEAGIASLRQLVGRPLSQPDVIVAGRLGSLPTLRVAPDELPLLRFLEHPRVYVPDVELVADAELSATSDPYLSDHVYQGTPLFAAVMGLEAMAQVAMTLTGSTQLPVLHAVRFERPIAVNSGARVTLRVAALAHENGAVEVVIRSSETEFAVDHFRCLCQFDELPLPDCFDDNGATTDRPFQTNGATGNVPLRLALDPCHDLYETILFHQGRFRRLAGYRQLSAQRCHADVTPAEQSGWFGPYLPPRLVLGDPGTRDAAIHAIQACIPHGTLLPAAVERIELAALTDPMTVLAQERSCRGDDFVYDIQLRDKQGVTRETWRGLKLRRVAQTRPIAAWPAPLVAPYLERRFQELVPHTRVSVSLLNQAHVARVCRSESAILAAVPAAATVCHRPDGKPEVDCGHSVSAAHEGRWTLAVSAEHPVTCDLQAFAERTVDEFCQLCGEQRLGVARLAARETGESLQAAAARIWCTMECLTKASASLDTPIVFESATRDDWVVFHAGPYVVATCIFSIREPPQQLATAILVKNDDSSL